MNSLDKYRLSGYQIVFDKEIRVWWLPGAATESDAIYQGNSFCEMLGALEHHYTNVLSEDYK